MSQIPNGKQETFSLQIKLQKPAGNTQEFGLLPPKSHHPWALLSDRWVRKTVRKAGYAEEGCAPSLPGLCEPTSRLGLGNHTTPMIQVGHLGPRNDTTSLRAGNTEPPCPRDRPENPIPTASLLTVLSPRGLTLYLSLLPWGRSPGSNDVSLPPCRVLTSKPGTPSSTHTPHPG